jgi:hypothetical protein
MVGDAQWREVGQRLALDDLISVTRGLVLFSQASGWTGGSVSPVIALYSEYLRRRPDDDLSLTSWIVDHRRNEYEPFGTTIHGGARTLGEFNRYQQERLRRAAEGRARDAERQRVDALAKAERATSRTVAAVKRGDVAALRALIAAGGQLHWTGYSLESLTELARMHGRGAMVEFLEKLAGASADPDPPTH